MRRTSRWISIAFTSLVVGLLLGVVVAGFLYYGRGLSRYVSTAETSYQNGMSAVREDKYAQAMTSFHEAILSCDNLFSELETIATEQRTQEEFEKDQRLLGQASWIKHRAIKARAFTRLLAEKKPLPTFEGQANGTPDQVVQKLSCLRIADDGDRREALGCLRDAAYRMPKSIDVLREAVATEIQIEPMHWNHVHAFATTLGEIDPTDERALYLLAKLEYEQPVSIKADGANATMPMPSAKRSKDRMLKGLDTISRLRAIESPTRWRTQYLEVQMLAWMMQYYRQPTQLKPEAEREYGQKLRTLLMNPETGALAQVAKAEKLGVASRLDLQGLFGLHQMALELIIDDSRHVTGNESALDTQRMWTEQVQRHVDQAVALVNKIKTPGRMTEIADYFTQCCLKTMPYLAQPRPAAWAGYRMLAVSLAQAARQENRLTPILALRVADLLVRDNQWQEQVQNKPVLAAAQKEMLDWIDAGLKLSDNKNNSVVLSLHEARLRLLVMLDSARDQWQPNLVALRECKHESSQAAAAFYEGVYHQRQGKLQAARVLLEQAARSPRSDLNRRALTMLVPIYLTLELPEQALKSLTELERYLTRMQSMSTEERAWFFSMIRNPDELAVDRVQAHILAAHQAQFQISQGGRAAVDAKAALAQHEGQIKQLITKSSTDRTLACRMQLAWTQYLLQWNRAEEAQPHVVFLKQAQPDWLPVLQLEIGLAMAQCQAQQTNALPAALVSQVDEMIQNYLKRPQANRAGKLVWLKWLSNTGRAKEAQLLCENDTYLGNTTNDAMAAKLKAMAYLYIGKREQSHALLQALPSDPQVDVALMQTAHTLSEQQNILASALQNHHDVGLFRTWSAAIALSRGDHAEACQSLVNCLEYTRVRPLVRQALTEGFLAWAQYQPVEARKLAVDALQHYPSESCLLLAYAYASLQVGDIGNPTDNGDQVKDMATALKAFEAAWLQERRDPSVASWIECQCWMMSPRRDLAQQYARKTLELNPRHEPAYVLSLQLLLQQPSAQVAQQASALCEAYRKYLPDSVDALYWQGRCMAHVGKYNDALALYRQVMEKSPRHGETYKATCELLMKQSNPETLAACRQVIQRWKAALPADPLCACWEVQYTASQGTLTDCRASLDQYLERLDTQLRSDAPVIPVSTDKQTQLMRQKAEAICVISQGLQRNQQYPEMEAWLQRALELSPECETAHLMIGQMQMKKMNAKAMSPEERKAIAQKAVSAYSAIYRRNQANKLAGNQLAWLMCTELNDPLEAYRIMQELRMPRHSVKPLAGDMLPLEMLDTLAMIYQTLARPEYVKERIDLFEAAHRRYADDPRVAVYLAQSCLAAGDGKRALTLFQAARQLLPKSSLEQEVLTRLNQQIQVGLGDAQSRAN